MRQLTEAAKSGSDAFSGFGESLASAASSPYEDRLREPARLAKNISYELKEMAEKSSRLVDLINQRDASLQDKILNEMLPLTILARAKVNHWDELKRKS